MTNGYSVEVSRKRQNMLSERIAKLKVEAKILNQEIKDNMKTKLYVPNNSECAELKDKVTKLEEELLARDSVAKETAKTISKLQGDVKENHEDIEHLADVFNKSVETIAGWRVVINQYPELKKTIEAAAALTALYDADVKKLHQRMNEIDQKIKDSVPGQVNKSLIEEIDAFKKDFYEFRNSINTENDLQIERVDGVEDAALTALRAVTAIQQQFKDFSLSFNNVCHLNSTDVAGNKFVPYLGDHSNPHELVH